MATLDQIASGLIAGIAATAPMTIAMKAMHRRLPTEQKYPLPPRIITEKIAEQVGAEKLLDREETSVAATLIGHFAYGAAAGALYGALRDGREGTLVRAGAEGVAYGLAVWTGSYVGLLPATGLFPTAAKQPAERNALMIAAHVVWGGTLGVADAVLRDAEDAFSGSILAE